ncbi:MAG: hypothetical protein GWP14_10300 [Actinobacteria bacterium]|nr:hypothetical protein [Actinomycetota bacterium]
MGLRDVSVQSYRTLNVVHPKLADQLNEFRMRLSAINAGYPNLTDWHPTMPPGWASFPKVPFERAIIYRGSAQSWAYSHHQAITKLTGKYVAAWSNGFIHEDYVGQEVHWAWSSDGVHWSEPKVVAPTPVESGLVKHNAGLYSSEGRLYCYVGVAKNFGPEAAAPNMSSLNKPQMHLDVYETSDLENWNHYEHICDDIYLFEGPRMTQGGKLMCCGFDPSDHHGRVLIWNDPSQPTASPSVVEIPESPEAVLPEQGTWYQTEDGRIWMYQRDSSISCRLALTWSNDGGETWSELLRTDFPNSYSRAFAGQLNDGRYYIVGNNYDVLLHRRALLIALSDDGYIFDRQYTLVEGNTTRRINGQHKEDGYHYPNCFADGNKLFVIYSVNKEDIEVGMVDTSKVD